MQRSLPSAVPLSTISFGRGDIKSIVEMGDKHLAVIGFKDGDKKMFLEFAPLKLVK